jgi:adenylate cyclase
MHTPPRILIVDDNDANRDILEARLAVHGYQLIQGTNGEEAIALARQHLPDLILLDVMMPKIDGIEVCRQLKSDQSLPYMPIILVTAKADTRDVVTGLEAGADEYLSKPVDQTALVARVKSVLRLKALHDQVQAQAGELAALNRTLEARVAAQVAEIERMGRLRRFLSPQIANLVLADGQEHLLDSHRREVTVIFCDLRGFTAFAETAEPEEVMAVLNEYHRSLGQFIHRHEGTLAHFAGDGAMVIFNDPVPCSNPCERAVRMADGLRAEIGDQARLWRRYGHEFGFGVGIAHGYATLGCIGFKGRQDYSAIGTVVNLAARLCSDAANGQILIDGKVQKAVEPVAESAPAGEVTLKGIRRPVRAFELLHLRQ